jgi:DNA invertase Pin-like site-specific DNA recombinase
MKHFGYVRLALADDARLQEQMQRIKGSAIENGIQIDDLHCDFGSGNRSDHPGLAELCDSVAGRPAAVHLWTLDRLGRSNTAFEKNVVTLRDAGIDLIFVWSIGPRPILVDSLTLTPRVETELPL